MSELWDVYTKDRKRTVKTYPIGTLKQYKYVVTLSFYEGKILLSRHKDRTTWETQGGHVEAGETTFEAAKRELYEESGAVDYDIVPLCDYWAGTEDESKGAYGMVFCAKIRKLDAIPESEMAEVKTFDTLPDNLTYPAITPNLFAYLKEYEKKSIFDIVGDNYLGTFTKSRATCRAIIIEDGKILLSYEKHNDQWMIPGGGLEAGESDPECCIREVAEETGAYIEVSECKLEIDEYYGDVKWIDLYFIGRIVGRTATHLTEREKEAGMEPRWIPVEEALRIFAKHQDYAATDEMRRGMYLRECTALSRILLDMLK